MTIPELATLLAERHHARYHDEPWADLSAGQQAVKVGAMGDVLEDLRRVQSGFGGGR